VMELVGFNPMIILVDADMDYAVRTVMFGSFSRAPFSRCASL